MYYNSFELYYIRIRMSINVQPNLYILTTMDPALVGSTHSNKFQFLILTR